MQYLAVRYIPPAINLVCYMVDVKSLYLSPSVTSLFLIML